MEAWPCYRLVLVEQVATWTEVNEKMSIDDVDDMCQTLDRIKDIRREVNA